MADRSAAIIILAAGEGTRMRSARPKVAHAIAGRPMIQHVLSTAAGIEGSRRAVVVGPGMAEVEALARAADPEMRGFTQAERLGTAHAVLSARAVLQEGADDILVLFGDTPLVRRETLERLRAPLREGAAVAVLGFEARDPAGYGRLLVADGMLEAIREEKDASEAERRVTFCNSGVMALDGRLALDLLDAVGNRNAKGEYYLTDVVAIARRGGRPVVALEADEEEVLGVNTRAQLAGAEAVLQRRLRAAALEAGVTMIAPETVFLAHDTALARDVVVEPNVVFGPRVSVGEGAVIHAFSHLEGASVAPGASVGPYARLRPGADLAPGARVGNFVEIKAARVGEGAKVNHLSYIGDAEIGARANIGAGTITCNYDGFAKHRTRIGPGAFIGSNSALVAPVLIGEGAYVGSGSVITQDVAPDALAIGRGRQVAKPGWAAAFRARMRELVEQAKQRSK